MVNEIMNVLNPIQIKYGNKFQLRNDTTGRAILLQGWVKRTERGWAGHFILADRCGFRRNTLLELGKHKWIVSTVGNLRTKQEIEQIGHNRYYETLIFEGTEIDGYIDADVTKQIEVDPPGVMCAESKEDLVNKFGLDCDNYANNMHEIIVSACIRKLAEIVRIDEIESNEKQQNIKR